MRYTNLNLKGRWNVKLRVLPVTAAVSIWVSLAIYSLPAFSSEIHDAATSGDLAKVEALLKENPGLVNVRDNQGFTPLHNAAARGHREIVELLLINKAEVNARTTLGDAPAGESVPLTVALLYRQLQGATPLHMAAFPGHQEVAESLLAHGADVNAKNQDGATPLHLAALAGRKGMAELLLAHGAEVNAKNRDSSHAPGMPMVMAEAPFEGSTPLQWAAAGGHRDVAELLLEKGAAVNTQNATGYSPLFAAVSSGDAKTVSLLLDKKADANAKMAGGFVAADVASVQGYKEIEQLLRQHMRP